MSEQVTTDQKLPPRTAYAHEVFRKHYGRAPDSRSLADRRWLQGYVAALEDLPDNALASLGLR